MATYFTSPNIVNFDKCLVHIKNIKCAIVWCTVHYISNRSYFLVVLFRFFISLPTFYLPVLLATERSVLKSATMIEDMSISIFSSIHFCFIYFHTIFLGAFRFGIIIASCWIDLLIIFKYPVYL